MAGGSGLLSRGRDSAAEAGMRVLERLFGQEVLPPEAVDRNSIRSILVVRQHDQLGDFLLSTPVVRALRGHFPAARIGLLVRGYFQGIARLVPSVDEVLVYRERIPDWSWKNGGSFLRALRGRWDLAVVPTTVSHSLTSDFLAHYSGARYLLGSEARVFRGATRNFFYNLVARACDEGRHQTQCNLDIVRHIGVDTADPSPRLVISESERHAALRGLAELGFRSGLPAVAMHLGAGKKPNRWPVAHFAELARRVSGPGGAQVILFWGPGEEELRSRFAESAGVQTIDAGHPELARLGAICAECTALVCNDTGIMHLGAAAGAPVVAIFGPTDPEIWKPLGAGVIALRAPSHRTEDVPVAGAMSALRSLVGDRIPLLP
jgi:ADP-heptose:LPS heptosyltransferase